MRSFDEGCSHLLATMDGWIAEESVEICGAAVADGHPLHKGMLARVWNCWKMHWKEEAAPQDCDGMRVAEQIRGIRPRKGFEKLGANLIHDVVLVEAVISGHDHAITYFDSIYRQLAVASARTFDVSLQDDLSWWEDTKSHLVGTSLEPGYLRRYEGKGSLRSLMRQAIKNDLVRQAKKLRLRRSREKPLPESHEGVESHDTWQSLEIQECFELFRSAWRETISAGSPEEQAAVKLVFDQRLTVTEAAQVLGRNKGVVSRHRRVLLRRFEEMVMTPDRRFIPRYRDCGEYVFGATGTAPRMFAELHRLLAELDDIEKAAESSE